MNIDAAAHKVSLGGSAILTLMIASPSLVSMEALARTVLLATAATVVLDSQELIVRPTLMTAFLPLVVTDLV